MKTIDHGTCTDYKLFKHRSQILSALSVCETQTCKTNTSLSFSECNEINLSKSRGPMRDTSVSHLIDTPRHHHESYTKTWSSSSGRKAGDTCDVSPIKLTQFTILGRTYRFSEPRVFHAHLDHESSYWVLNDDELNIHIFESDEFSLRKALQEELDYLMVNYSSHPETDLNEKTIARIRRLKSILERVS